MRVVVTGAGGFIGRAVVASLSTGHDVVAVDRHLPPQSGSAPSWRAVQGDLGDPATLDRAFVDGCDAVVHLVTVSGGAAEEDPQAARRVNLDAAMALTDRVVQVAPGARFVFASSIAVFGDPLPPFVDDETPPAPRLIYGAQKLMMEAWIAAQSRRGGLQGLSLRLPGVVARPRGAAGFRSAFMSDVFHVLKTDQPFVSPVSPSATLWLMSVDQVVDTIGHALTLHQALEQGGLTLTLPALRVRFDDLIAQICAQTGRNPAQVAYEPEPALEAAFGALPPLSTPRAEALGFRHDGDLERLVRRALHPNARG